VTSDPHARAVPAVADLGRLLRALALPTFALALAVSVLTTYVPVLLRNFTSSRTAIGFAVGGEGLFALFLPLVAGSLSDRTQPTRLGRRLPYAIAAAPVLALALVLIPFAGSYGATVALIFLFFVAYFVYYPPYQALYAELVPSSHHGRAQGAQGSMRGLGLGAALVGGGLLLSAWTPLPFLIAAVVVLLATAVLVREVREPAASPVCCVPYGLRGTETTVRRLLRELPELRAFVAANALWELSFVGLKTFIVLYIVEGLGRSVGTASAVIGVVAGAYVIASLGAGRLADRIGLERLMRAALWVYGVGLLLGTAVRTLEPALIGLPVVALAGAALMTLPYSLLVRMIPAGAEGAVSGLYGFSRGLGAIAGPLLVGAAIDLLQPFFPSTDGYAAMWIAIGVPILISLPLLSVMERRSALRASEAAPPPGTFSDGAGTGRAGRSSQGRTLRVSTATSTPRARATAPLEGRSSGSCPRSALLTA
jgi:MFS family permease